MATSILRLPLRLSARKTGIMSRNTGLKTSNISRTTQIRTAVSTASGAILPKPDKTPFGLIRMTVVVVPFLYVGTLISKNFAALLEEHDIFVPEDDDDDDWANFRKEMGALQYSLKAYQPARGRWGWWGTPNASLYLHQPLSIYVVFKKKI